MRSPISVAFEATTLTNRLRTGIQIYTSKLLREMLKRPEEVSVRVYYTVRPFKDAKRVFMDFPKTRAYIHSAIANVGDAEITHSTDNKFLFKRQCKNIATIHDCAIFLPENDVPGYTSPEFRSRQYAVYNNILRKADLIIAVSESTRSDIIKVFNVDPDRIKVVYHGIDSANDQQPSVDDAVILNSHGLEPQKYLLYAGAITIRKNIPNLIEAFNRSSIKDELILVLAGVTTAESDEIMAKARSLGLSRSVIFTSYLNENELAALYRNARAFVFPTYYEGFGMPILEAMSFGLPVLVGNRGAAPEIAGGHAIEVDPHSIEKISMGITKVAEAGVNRSDLRSHAAQFTWNTCIKKIVDIYKELLDK